MRAVVEPGVVAVHGEGEEGGVAGGLDPDAGGGGGEVVTILGKIEMFTLGVSFVINGVT